MTVGWAGPGSVVVGEPPLGGEAGGKGIGTGDPGVPGIGMGDSPGIEGIAGGCPGGTGGIARTRAGKTKRIIAKCITSVLEISV